MASAGIFIKHTQEVSTRVAEVRGDLTVFIGVIPSRSWPLGHSEGDFLRVCVSTYADLIQKPVHKMFDPVTVRAVRAFFENGGVDAILYGLCLSDADALLRVAEGGGGFEDLLYDIRGGEEVGIMCMPVLAYLPCEVVNGVVHSPADVIWNVLLRHCAEVNFGIVLVDTPKDLMDGEVRAWSNRFAQLSGKNACFGAIYYPWLQNGDERLPPSGSVAGMFARIEAANRPFGIWKPPANEELRGVTHTSYDVLWSEVEKYSNTMINPILHAPNRGVVVWGARTLSSDTRWEFINSRRIVSVVAAQVRKDADWAVFETHQPALWESVEQRVRGRLDQMWACGLLTGQGAGDEYSVQCDGSTNTPDVVNRGVVNIRVWLQPISTTEKIVVELSLGVPEMTVGSAR
jgi:hypothetical protein